MVGNAALWCTLLLAFAINPSADSQEQVFPAQALDSLQNLTCIVGNCSFYECFESLFPCGPEGYALAYGLRYCEAFTDARPEFTPRGQVWVNATKLCLMESLWNDTATFTPTTSCADIKEMAMNAHVHCYADPAPGVSICDIPENWLRIVELVKSAVLYDPTAFVDEVVGTIAACAHILS
jgi:hypothetical protein